jgi:nucleotide-binding universal stress UspA family protein
VIRRVLVAVDGSPDSAAAQGTAIDWAYRTGAQLVGFGVVDEPSITRGEIVAVGATEFEYHRQDDWLAEAHERVAGLLAAFGERCQAAGVAWAVVWDVGRPQVQIVREAEACDVVVLGRETHFQAVTGSRPDRTLHGVLRSSARPVAVVPAQPVPGEGVLVAYGEGREIARTLHTLVLLGLSGGERVELLAVGRDRAEVEGRLQRPGRLLSAHGVPHRPVPVVSEASPAEVILEEARRRRPRLLVVGAQGSHPIRDLFVTSVTRAVLADAPVAVLVGA